QVADAARQSFEEPHVRTRRRQLDVTQTLAAHFRQRDFHAALVADHAAVLHALVLAAQALPVGDRAKNARAEQAVALRLKSAVINGFGLRHLAMRPAPDFFRRAQADTDSVEISNRVCQVKRARTEQDFLQLCGIVAAVRGSVKVIRWLVRASDLDLELTYWEQ